MNIKSNTWNTRWFYSSTIVVLICISGWYNYQQHQVIEDIHGFSVELLDTNKELRKYEEGWNTLTKALGIPEDQAKQLLDNINIGR
jgi:hypothetical protein